MYGRFVMLLFQPGSAALCQLSATAPPLLPNTADGALRPEFRDDCPEPYRRLAERCWHQDPE